MAKKIVLIMFAGMATFALVATTLPTHKALADREGGEKENSSQGKIGVGEMKKISGAMSMDKMMEQFESANEGGGRSVMMKANGDFKVSGVTVNSVSTSTNVLNVSFFGFNRDVNVGGARIIGGGNVITLADIKPGDKLTGSGNFNESTRAITVSEIRDVSFAGRNTENIKARIQELWNLIQKLQNQLKGIL